MFLLTVNKLFSNLFSCFLDLKSSLLPYKKVNFLCFPFSMIFWLGDLNYRFDELDPDQVKLCIKDNDYSRLYSFDQVLHLCCCCSFTKFSFIKWRCISFNQSKCENITAWKVSVFGVFLVRIFLHSDWIRRYSVSLRIRSECAKTRTRKTPNTDTFHAVYQMNFGYIVFSEQLLYLPFQIL